MLQYQSVHNKDNQSRTCVDYTAASSDNNVRIICHSAAVKIVSCYIVTC